MQAPARSGTLSFNDKKTHSIVLMAICNARFLFIIVNIGDSGTNSDGSVYGNISLGYVIVNKQLKLLGKNIKSSQRILAHVFVGDDAFGLKPHVI